VGSNLGRAIRRAGAFFVVAPVVASSACGDGEVTTTEAAAAETADIVCTMLRDRNNELTASVNATARSITDDDDPDTANAVLADGLDDLIEIAEDHVAALDSLRLPATHERGRLLDDLRTGAQDGIAILDGERDEVAALPPITVDRQRGAIGGVFMALEGAQAALEPAIVRYDDEVLRQAFADDEDCRHVVQPF
jgi:hypothetical protein